MLCTDLTPCSVWRSTSSATKDGYALKGTHRMSWPPMMSCTAQHTSAAEDGYALQQLNLLQCVVCTAHLNAYLLPVNALSSVLLRLEALAATSIEAAVGGRIVDALIEAHLLVTTASGAGEGHALDQRLRCTDPYHSALDTHDFACSHAPHCLVLAMQ